MRRSQRIPTLPLFLGIAHVATQALAADFPGRVVGVSDGDTITQGLQLGLLEAVAAAHPESKFLLSPRLISFGVAVVCVVESISHCGRVECPKCGTRNLSLPWSF